MTYQSVSPYNGEVFKTFEELSNEQLEMKIAAAAACFDGWRQTTFAERAVVVARAAGIMRERNDEFARAVTFEMGKLIGHAMGEVDLSAGILDYNAENAERFLVSQHLEPSSGEAKVETSPLGMLFGVQPWIFRFISSPGSPRPTSWWATS